MPKFYSTKEGALCTRYGTGTYIGAALSVENGAAKLVFDPECVVSITDEEFAKYNREYSGLVAEGSLIERDASDFAAHNDKLSKAAEAETKQIAEVAKAATDATAKAEKDSTAGKPTTTTGNAPKTES